MPTDRAPCSPIVATTRSASRFARLATHRAGWTNASRASRCRANRCSARRTARAEASVGPRPAPPAPRRCTPVSTVAGRTLAMTDAPPCTIVEPIAGSIATVPSSHGMYGLSNSPPGPRRSSADRLDPNRGASDTPEPVRAMGGALWGCSQSSEVKSMVVRRPLSHPSRCVRAEPGVRGSTTGELAGWVDRPGVLAAVVTGTSASVCRASTRARHGCARRVRCWSLT